MTTSPQPADHGRHVTNLAAALRQCPRIDETDVATLIEAAEADLRAWTHTLAAEWSKTYDLVERRAA